jgi:hypothetical protein
MTQYENDVLYPEVKKRLELMGWHVEKTHGNLWQIGWPDLMIIRTGVTKWIELKSTDKNKLRTSQCMKFGMWHRHGVKIYIINRNNLSLLRTIIEGEPNWIGFIR